MSELQYFQSIPVERLRDQVIEQLKVNYAHNNIVMEEFERRLELATATEDRSELLKVVNDLPVINGEDAVRDSGGANSPNRVSINTGQIRSDESMLSVFSATTRKGVWRPSRYTKLLAVFGGADLDYTRAYLPPGEFNVEIMCMFGGVELLVPDGMNVEINGLPIFGGLENKTSGEYIPGAPTLKVRAVALFGGVEVKHPGKRRRKRKR